MKNTIAAVIAFCMAFSTAYAQTPATTPVMGQVVMKDGAIHCFSDGKDGVVTYQSAHLAGMESEFIVHSSHSCQENPATIEELRRILLRHLDTTEASPSLGRQTADLTRP